ncbi:hypothetical protein MRX96_024282 [Rhipicephalus microplus]
MDRPVWNAYDVSKSSEQSARDRLQESHVVGLLASISESSTVVDDDESSFTTAVAAWRLYSGEALSEQLESDEDVDLSLAAAAARARLPPRLRRRGDLLRPLTTDGEGSFSPSWGEGGSSCAACLGDEGRASSFFFCAWERFCACTGCFGAWRWLFRSALRGLDGFWLLLCLHGCFGAWHRLLRSGQRGLDGFWLLLCLHVCVGALRRLFRRGQRGLDRFWLLLVAFFHLGFSWCGLKGFALFPFVRDCRRWGALTLCTNHDRRRDLWHTGPRGCLRIQPLCLQRCGG